MKETQEIHDSLISKLEDNLDNQIKSGSMLDMFAHSVAEENRELYQEIENAKNPHLFTNTWGEDLDSLGYWVGVTREPNEDDNTYKYRLKEWVFLSEASNTRAISTKLLNPEYASNIDYVPKTHGCGTGTCYIIPKEYENDVIANALTEAKQKIAEIVSPSLYIEYIVPTIRAVRLNCFLTTEEVDESQVKNTIADKIKTYINSIAPGDLLKVGELLRIGLGVTGTEYFNVMAIMIDEEPVIELEIAQELETKLLFDEIIWSGVQ